MEFILRILKIRKELNGKSFTINIFVNTKIKFLNKSPCNTKFDFSTSEDLNTSADIQVYINQLLFDNF